MKIAITGAAGSLGREMVKYLLEGKLDVVGLDNSEWAVAEARNLFPTATWHLMDFYDYDYEGIDAVVHLAAYKHVDLGESNPEAFIENNVYKTSILFRKLKQAGIAFLFVSTDKAVEPISLYGYTKAIGEKLAWHYGGSVARLGNILLSSGSVIPAWEAQIRDNKPITITDERMTRYLINADTAVKEIWSGFTMNMKLIVPRMDEPAKLVDICATVLAKHGYKKMEDYKPGFIVTGLRPGEKIHEKLKWENE